MIIRALPGPMTAVAVIMMLGPNIGVAADMSDFDKCVIEQHPDNPLLCNVRTSQSPNNHVETKTDSTDQNQSSTAFRFAGSCLNTSQVGDAYDGGTGEFDWRGPTGCLKFESTVKKAQFRREDGVVSELPLLDQDGNLIDGTEKAYGDSCDTELTFRPLETSRTFQPPRSWNAPDGYSARHMRISTFL